MLDTAGDIAENASPSQLSPSSVAEEAPHARPEAIGGDPTEEPTEPEQNERGHAQLTLTAKASRLRGVSKEQPSVGGGGDLLTPKTVNRLVPHSARVWDYLLGGRDNYEADRRTADAFHEVYPGVVELVAAQRGFGRRAVEYLVEEGVRQFIDIGPGLPSSSCRTRTTDTRATDTLMVARTAAANSFTPAP